MVYSRFSSDQDVLECERLVLRVSRSLARDWNDADDLAQDSWVAALHSAPENLRSPSSWMARIARRGAAGQTRARLRRSDVEQLSYEAKFQDSPLEELAQIGASGEVRRALDRLASKYREVIFLRYFEDLTHLEISKRLVIPLDTTRTRLKRGLSKLRKEFEVDGQLDRSRWCLLMAGWVREEQHMAGTRAAQLGSSLSAGVAGFSAALVGAFALVTLLFGLGHAKRASTERVALGSLNLERVSAQPAATFTPKNAPREAVRMSNQGVESIALGVVVRAQSDQAPLPGVVLCLERLGVDHSTPQTTATDVEGRALLAFAETGEYLLTSDLGHARLVQLVAGEARAIELSVDGDLVVRGQTQSLDGTLLPWADVWIYPQGDLSRGRIGARSDRMGNYELRGVLRSASLSAGTADQVIGDLRRVVDLADRAGGSKIIGADLRTAGPARVCTGTITDEFCRPLAGVRIQAQGGVGRRGYRFSPSGGMTIFAPSPMAYTDVDGNFTLEGVRGSYRTLNVSLPGYIGQRVILEWVKEMPSRGTVVRLSRGASLTGFVQGPSGERLSGVRIEARSRHTAASCSAISDARGAFQLRGLELGEHEVSAVGAGLLRADSSLEVRDLGAYSWNPLLVKAATIRGHISSAEFGSLMGFGLELVAERQDAASIDQQLEVSAATRLGADGGFSMATRDEGPFELRLWSLKGGSTPVAAWRGLRKSLESIELRVESVRADCGQVRATLTGDTRSEHHVELWSSALKRPLVLSEGEHPGNLAAEGLWPGSYGVVYFSAGRAPVRLKDFQLEAGEHLDLGSLEVPAAASVRIVMVGGDAHVLSAALGARAFLAGANGSKLALRLEHATGEVERLSEREFQIGGLAPGSYAFSLSGSHMAWRQEQLDLVAGAETVVEWNIAVREYTHLEFTFPARVTAKGSAFTVFRSDRGEVFVRLAVGRHGYLSVYASQIVLGEGNWTVESVSDDWHTITSFSVPASGPVIVGESPWEYSEAAAAFSARGEIGFKAIFEYAQAQD